MTSDQQMRHLLEIMGATGALTGNTVTTQRIVRESVDGGGAVHPEDWPGLAMDAEGEDSTHPVIAAFDVDAVESLEIVSEWTDDHLPCVGVRATIAGQVYEWSDWCLSRSGIKMYYQAEFNTSDPDGPTEKNVRALRKLRAHMRDWAGE